MQLKEDFLHFIWHFGLYSQQNINGNPGEKLQVLNPGVLNRNSGPDFDGARIRIGEMIWVGQVEIHIKASDWYLHGHGTDPAYNNVILHVVYEADRPVYRKDGTQIPVLVLKDHFAPSLLFNYQQLLNSLGSFPCEQLVRRVEPVIINSVLSRQLVERLEYKKEEILKVLNCYKGDWERTFFHFLALSFGFKVNALPFEFLAQSLDLQMIKRHRDKPLQVNALFFGQAGFLNRQFEEVYPASLYREYAFFSKKYNLKPISDSLWKFLRMRPQNFPTLRIAQLAGVLLKHDHLFFSLLDFYNFQDYYKLFEQLEIDEYWCRHYHFNKISTQPVSVQIGKKSIENIITNTICPFMYVYGAYTGQDKYAEKAIDLLEYLPPEENSILTKYKEAGLKMKNAFQSQAVLQLNKSYCNQKKCLNCSIGIKILKK